MLIVPTRKDHSTALVIRDTLDMVFRVKVMLDQESCFYMFCKVYTLQWYSVVEQHLMNIFSGNHN